ncbi:MAG: chemotaxis response regulator protein-glutamate methylesterase [Desulfamplus sp.]|nr:chemotaxis response regulator protein-glutamate methylesterase [Desulfamplus sp.]
MKKIRVLICDDSALMRRSLTRIIEDDPALSVIGVARDGEDAVGKARDLRPDVITMDINMPGLDGITALQYIMADKIAPVIMVSSLTQEGATATFQAMALGAFDYVAKPGGTVSANLDAVSREIQSKIKAAASSGTLNRLLRQKGSRLSGISSGVASERSSKKRPEKPSKTASKKESRVSSGVRSGSIAGSRDLESGSSSLKTEPRRIIGSADLPDFKAVAMGISTGGPKTLYDVLPLLPKDLNAAVILVQHMPPKFIASFAKRIDDNCQMHCVEVEAGMEIEPGTIYIGKGGYHLTLYRKLSKKVVVRTPTKPEHAFMPSVDVMMQSVLEVFKEQTVGVLMTGMGDDGAASMVDITRAGCTTIAESEESAIVFGMPREAIERGGAKVVVPSWDIAQQIIKAVR